MRCPSGSFDRVFEDWAEMFREVLIGCLRGGLEVDGSFDRVFEVLTLMLMEVLIGCLRETRR